MRLSALAALLLAAPAPAQFQSRIYQAPKTPVTQAALPTGARLITVVTRDGLTLTGAEIAAKPGRPTLLVLHGNGSSAATMLDWLKPLADDGYGLVAADYRGYSANPGKPDEAGLARDADAFYDEALRLDGGAPVLVVGHSLGGGVAFGVAMRHHLAGLITIGAFSRLCAMAPPLLRALISDRYDNLADVPRLDEPLFLIHGDADATVPPSEGALLYQAATDAHNPGQWFRIAGAGHHPDGRLLATLIEAAAALATTPGAPIAVLPAGVRAGRFVR